MPQIVLTEELIMKNLDTLSHGGKGAIVLFIDMCKRLHEQGAKGALEDWVTIAAPALPEKERNEVLVMLMGSHSYLNWRTPVRFGAGASATTLH
jgi:hypothetical protein